MVAAVLLLTMSLLLALRGVQAEKEMGLVSSASTKRRQQSLVRPWARTLQ
jgi:hypothetical protein